MFTKIDTFTLVTSLCGIQFINESVTGIIVTDEAVLAPTLMNSVYNI